MTPLKYTFVPIIASLRWHVTNVGWRWIFRGNMDFTFSGSITPIPRGPETHYYAFMFGIRRNFVYRNWKVVPFFEQRGGAGMIDAKEPLGVLWAQGQNLTFTYNMGAGVRYNLDSKYSFSGGMNYMHISNGYLSEPQFVNYGINVYGPMFGMNVRLGKRITTPQSRGLEPNDTMRPISNAGDKAVSHANAAWARVQAGGLAGSDSSRLLDRWFRPCCLMISLAI